MSEVTRILDVMQQGDPNAADELLPLVYDELRRLAAHRMANEAPGQTFQPTALDHEAWLRLTGDEAVKWDGRAHFFAAAAEAMRRILIDNAQHGGGQQRVDIAEVELAPPGKDEQMLAMNDALEKFAAFDPVKADLVKLRYFVGMTIEEVAAAFGISTSTAKRHWAYARAWLYRDVSNQSQAS